MGGKDNVLHNIALIVQRSKFLEPSQSFDSWVIVLHNPQRRPCEEAGLVLSARGLENRISAEGQYWCLAVPGQYAETARFELAAYAAENDRRLEKRALPEVESGWNGVIVYVTVLFLIATLTLRGAFNNDWLAAGRLEAGRVIEGEWWRALTALTLHADLSHLLANIAFGSFFGLYVGRYLGSGVGWATILTAGVLGNLINAAVQPAFHRSIGASTAVFGALGLLAAYTWRRGFLKITPWRVRIAPVIAGIALLAYTGTGGENTDVIAHLTGFSSGFVLGMIHGRVGQLAGPATQRITAWLAIGCLIGAWYLAFL